MAICALCKQEKELCNSHIIPRFFYKPMFDQKGRIIEITNSSGNKKRRYLQDGLYEKLLCFDCEQKLNEFEKHVNHIFFNELKYYETKYSNEIIAINIDYSKFKLFQLSLLWRASVSQNEFFDNVKLGLDEEEIREMIINNDPGKPHEYPCVMVGLTLDNNEAFRFIMPASRDRIDGHISYGFVFGSCFWMFLVSKILKGSQLEKYFLTKNGTVIFQEHLASKIPFISKYITNLI